MPTVNYKSFPKGTIAYPTKSLNYAIISYYGNTVATTVPVYSGIQNSGVYTTPDLSFNTLYTFTITPYNITGVSGSSKIVTMNTTPYVVGVYSTISTNSNAQIQWYGTYSYVKIYRSISAPFSTPYIDLSVNINPYNDIDLSGNTTYNYFVRPFDANDNAYTDSSTITFTTNVQSAQDLSAIFYDTSGIMISFTAPKNSYSSSYYYQLNAVYSGSTTSTIGTSSPLLVNGLLSGATYSCYILSYLDGVLRSTSVGLNVNTIQSNKIIYYTFDNDTSVSTIKNVIDGSANTGNSGTLSLNTTTTISGTKSLQFTGGSFWTPFFTIPTGGFSVSVWFYPTNFNGGGNPRIYQVYRLSDTQSIMYPATTSSSVTLNQNNGTLSLGTINLNTWYNLIITFNITANQSKFYLNNSLVSTQSTAYYTAGNTESFSFGAKQNGGVDFFIGYMDNISIYNIVLSASDVSSIYVNKL